MKIDILKKIMPAPLTLAANALFSAADGVTDLARLLHYYKVAHLEFNPRPEDIFIVTYPRSGTTWLQMILYQLSTDGSMEIDHIAQKIPWFERLIHYRIWQAEDFEAMASPRIFKSHLTAGEMPKGPGKYIYMVRNGYDVALSYFKFYRSHLGFKGNFDQFFTLFMEGKVQFGSWFDHAASWKNRAEVSASSSFSPSPSPLPSNKNSQNSGKHSDHPSPQVLLLNFETLKNDFDGQLDNLIDFCGFSIPADRRAEIRHRCGFEFMKHHEDKFDHITAQIWEKGYQRSSFIRKGKSGLGQESFKPEQTAHFENTLKKFHIENLCP